MDKHVVIMFELNKGDEKLNAPSQVNEVFGIFDSSEEAEEWSKRAEELIKNRHWLIIPLSNPSVLNSLDPMVN